MKNTVRQKMQRGLFLSAIGTAVLLAWLGARLIPESTPVARGAIIAYMGGCIECHGQPEDAPSANATVDCARDSIEPTHPNYAGSCRDLLAYFEAVRLKRTINKRASTQTPNRLLQGELLAREYSCFQCHGELGQGGFRNTGALKGYIPGYFGDDFAQLTRGGNAESIQAWIGQGIDPALFEFPIKGTIAEFFIEHQAVSMPKFGTLSDAEIRILTDYVIALNKFGAMDAESIRAYGRRTQQL